MNVDLTEETWPKATDLRVAASNAGDKGTVTITSGVARLLAEQLDRVDDTEKLRDLAADLLKGVVLQGAARAAIPIPEDVRALVRLARELDAELKTPTPWPVEKPAPEEEDD